MLKRVRKECRAKTSGELPRLLSVISVEPLKAIDDYVKDDKQGAV